MSLSKIEYYGENGKLVGSGVNLHTPHYLDWMPIELKMFWFLSRGYGAPATKQVLMTSQGERMLGTVPEEKPLRELHFTELQEIDNGLEQAVDEYARDNGIKRTPRNQ